MSGPDDHIRDAIQEHILDAAGDGWTLAQYVLAMGLQKIEPDGTVSSTAWAWAPPNQPGWQSMGLLEFGQEILSTPFCPDEGND